MVWNSDFKIRRKWSGVELAIGVEPRFFLYGVEWMELGYGSEWGRKEVEYVFSKIDWSGIKKSEWSETGVEWKWSGVSA